MKCSLSDCSEPQKTRGFCGKHYQCARRDGTIVLAPRKNAHPNDTLRERLLANVREEHGCLVWTQHLDDKGYGRINWKGKTLLVSRAAFEEFVRPLEPGEIVRHTCDNPPCIKGEHLVAGDHSDNRRDCVERGREARGVRCGSAKMTEDLVRQLRADRRRGATYKELQETYGIALGTISFIVNRKTWTHI